MKVTQISIDSVEPPSKSSSSESSSPPREGLSRIERPSAPSSSPSGLRQGINSPNMSPNMKRALLAAKRAGDNKKGSKFPKQTIWLMMIVAVFIDLVQFGIAIIADEYGVGEVLNDVFIDPTVELGFGIWFKIRGVSITNPTNFASYVGGFFIKEIGQGAIPFWFLEVGIIILSARAVEKVEHIVPGGSAMSAVASTSLKTKNPLEAASEKAMGA